jgi:4'-phosphopantetheinyl transferase
MKIYAVKIIDISEQQIDKLLLLINSDKRNKIKSFINKKDKIRSLLGEILIRTIIEEELHIGSKYITFEKNEYGKPYIREYPKFNFNISHSGDFVVCAIDDELVGIDIEEVKHIECEEIARNFFTTTEFDYIVKENLDIQLSKFYEIWTLKESYIKCCGQGLSIPLKSFSIDIDKYGNIKGIIKNQNKKYKFKSFDIELGYKMAVCSISKEVLNKIIRIEPNNLINNIITKSVD